MQIAAQLAVEHTQNGTVPLWELAPNWIPEMCAHALTTSQIQVQIEADQEEGNAEAGKDVSHVDGHTQCDILPAHHFHPRSDYCAVENTFPLRLNAQHCSFTPACLMVSNAHLPFNFIPDLL